MDDFFSKKMWRWERGDLIAVEFCRLRCRMHFALQYVCHSFVKWRDGFLDFAYTGFSCIDVFGYARRASFDALCHSVDACLPAFQFNLRLHVNCTRWKWQRVKSFEIPFCSNRHASMSVENSKSYPLHDVSFRLGVDLPFVTRERAARNQCCGAFPQVLNHQRQCHQHPMCLHWGLWDLPSTALGMLVLESRVISTPPSFATSDSLIPFPLDCAGACSYAARRTGSRSKDHAPFASLGWEWHVFD